ncbi:MAG: D-Ala-D-Ala carboxypeptidase family metallohydrolase [Hyphomicrobiaceae bacterium]|nr:D-Ala-D-Ala carboxypeptidase family metallohydrolase [Hyphomicrobiaceae bacterium]
MIRLITFLLRKARPALACAGLAAIVSIAFAEAAKADVPEYWTRETFRTSRSTVEPPRSRAASGEDRPMRRSRASRLGGPKSEAAATPRRRSAGTKVASLGNTYIPESKASRNLSGGGGIRWVASSSCLNGTLRGVLAAVAAQFGSVTVSSTCRSKSHNARVGGASRSMHLTGDAADFRVHGNVGGAAAYLRGSVGGYKHYGGGLFHIDTGARRTW